MPLMTYPNFQISKKMKNFIKPVLLFIIIVSFNVIANAQVSGTVFRDFNGSGVRDNSAPMFEPFIQGITVKAFNAANVQLGTTKTTDAVGFYSFTVVEIPAATAVRIEFSGLGTGDYSSFNGTGNGTNVQFVTAPNAATNFAVNAPDDYWSNTAVPNPKLLAIVYAHGDINHTNSANTTFGVIQIDNNTTGSTPTKVNVATQAQVGSVWGMGYQKTHSRYFFASFLKRHVGFGPQGVGGVYMANLSGANYALSGSFTLQGVTPSNSATALDMGTVNRVSTPNTSDFYLATGSDAAGRDMDAFGKSCKVGFGDVEVDDKNQQLIMVNLNQRRLVTVDISGTTASLNSALAATLGPLTKAYDILSLPGIPSYNTSTQGQLRPFALKIYKGRGYLGITGDASVTPRDSTNLIGYILSFDPTNIAAGFTTELTLNFNYRTSTSNGNTNRWHSWADIWTDVKSSGLYRYPEPLISDLEFDENGGINISITDRFGHQMGVSQTIPVAGSATVVGEGRISGDILHACRVGSAWVMEGIAGSCTPANTVHNADGYGDGQTVGVYEYYDDQSGDNAVGEYTQGAMAKLMGSNRLVQTIVDPTPTPSTTGEPYYYTAGMHWYDVNTGGWTNWTSLYDGSGATPVAGTFMKGNGLGDIEFVNAAAPIQVGNRIWNDTNGNGIQDAGETTAPVAAGTTVTLRSPGVNGIYGDGDDQTWTTTTDATGNYYFSALSSADNRKPAAWTGVGNTILPGYEYRIEIAVPAGFQLSKADAASNSFDNIDNDATQNGINAVVVFNTANINHNFDFGFKPLASLGDKVWRDDNKNATQDAGEPGVSGVSITLFRPGFGLDGIAATADDALPIANTVTDSYGNYLFDNLLPGIYQVQVNLPANYQFTTQSNTVDNTDGVATKDKGSDVNATTGLSYSVTLTAGENERNIDAGIIFNQPAAVSSIGDRVWYDTDGNGTQNAGEPGVSNVTVTLYKETAPASGVYVVYATTVTDVNGFYLFNNLPNNTNYKVGITPPAGTLLTSSTGTTAGNGTTDSDLDPTTRLSAVVNIPPAGAQITGIDVGLILQPTTKASLGDRVWYDNNRDGDQDAGEPGIAGVTVQLLNAANTILATTTTDAFGIYIFTNLSPGVYKVNFGAVAGMQRTSLNATGGTIADITDSDADPTTGSTQGYTLNAGGKNMSVDAGYYSTQPAANVGAIGDRVWVDSDGNGVQDAGEPSVAGVTITLYNNAGTAIAIATSDINGNYLFPGLTAGNYTVGFSNLPAGFGFTGQDKGGNDATDGDENPATGRTQTVTVTGGTTNITVDAGIRLGLPSGLGSLGNKVFIDLPGGVAGQQDAGELGVSGVTVQLYLDANGDGSITGAEQTAIATTTTNALGEYLFAGLNAGNYQVGFSNLPGSYTLTIKDAAGISDDEDSDGNAVNTAVNGNPAVAGKSYSDLISLAQGEDNLSVDLGLITPANTNTLGNYVWFDADSDGIQDAAENGVPGVMVTLYNNAGTAIAVTTTDATGQYLFAGLADGNYSVGFINYPSGFDLTTKSVTNDLTGSDADRITGRTATVALNFAAGGTSRDNRSLDAGLITVRAALGDKVWSDLNNNGTQDAGEYGIAGVTVSLFRPGFGLDGIAGNADDALVVASMITDGKGNYFFSNLIPGDYQLEFTTIPTGMLFTQQNTPGDNQNNTNSDAVPANANGRTGNITLSAGETDLTVDAGLTVPRPATIGNRVWNDFNANGIQDANEAGVAGFLVTLYNSVNQPIGSAVTDGNGNWQITNIPVGSGYYVIFSPNLPAFNTTPTPGSNPAWTTQNLGVNGASSLDSGTESDVDSDVTTTGANAGRTAAFNIVPGNNFPNIDAGIINWARGNTLPIQLVSFTAQPHGNNVQLNWVVATETNVAAYQVLYSTNGTNFTAIANQPATNSRNYSQLHTAPQQGLNYYRLKVIDIDGAVSYSEIRKVNFGKADDKIALYPIPANTSLNITVSAGMVNKPATISILSIDGRLMLQQTIPAISQTETINVSRLASGKYIVNININNEIINRQIEVIR
jgi:hypothetical protein